MNQSILEKAKQLFWQMLEKEKDDPWGLKLHIPHAEKWVKKILVWYPEVDEEILLLSVWLHDIGHYPVGSEDHAITGERIARKFLIEMEYGEKKREAVLHCIRSHRNKDIKPATLEAKVFCGVDSLSHFTYAPYIVMYHDGRLDEAIAKLERDFDDLKPLPQLRWEVEPLYSAWKKLLLELKRIDL